MGGNRQAVKATCLSNFVMTSYQKFGVQVDDKENMLILTSAKDLHYHTDNEMFQNRVRCLNRDHLRQMVDLNGSFWSLFRDMWQAELDAVRPKKRKAAK